MSDLKCNNCNAEFYIDVIEDSEESETPQFCPFCGSEDIGAPQEEQDEEEEYEDDEGTEEDYDYDEEE